MSPARPITAVCYVSPASSSTLSWMGWDREGCACLLVLVHTMACAHHTHTPAWVSCIENPLKTRNITLGPLDYILLDAWGYYIDDWMSFYQQTTFLQLGRFESKQCVCVRVSGGLWLLLQQTFLHTVSFRPLPVPWQMWKQLSGWSDSKSCVARMHGWQDQCIVQVFGTWPIKLNIMQIKQIKHLFPSVSKYPSCI